MDEAKTDHTSMQVEPQKMRNELSDSQLRCELWKISRTQQCHMQLHRLYRAAHMYLHMNLLMARDDRASGGYSGNRIKTLIAYMATTLSEPYKPMETNDTGVPGGRISFSCELRLAVGHRSRIHVFEDHVVAALSESNGYKHINVKLPKDEGPGFEGGCDLS